jgi:hypothetical protein
VLLNFQINYFLPPQMRAIFPVSTLKKHMWLSTPTKTAKKQEAADTLSAAAIEKKTAS